MVEQRRLTMKVYLTGGTGLLGSHFAKLAIENGASIVALARTTSDTSYLESLGAHLYAGDVTDMDSLVAGMRGCDVVVHMASPNGGQMSPEPYERVTRAGTEHVLAAMQFAQVERLVYISTIAVHGLDSVQGRPVSESDGFARRALKHDHYARAKIAAEQRVQTLHKDGHIRATTLRPGWMFGEIAENSYSRLADALRAGKLFKVGAGNNHPPLVYAGNVAHATWLAVTQPSEVYCTYICAGEGTLTENDLFESLKRAAGVERDPLTLPKPLALGLAKVQEEVSALSGYRLPVLFNQYLIHMLGSEWRFDQRRLRDELGYTPLVTPAEALARTEQWYRETRCDCVREAQ